MKKERIRIESDRYGLRRERFWIPMLVCLGLLLLALLAITPTLLFMHPKDRLNEWKISREIRSEFSQVQRAQVRCVPGPAHFETILTVKRTDDETLMELAKQAIPFCQDILEEMYPASWPPTSKYDTYSLLIFFDLDDDRRADRFFVYDFRSNIIRQEENKPSDSYFHETKRPFACEGRLEEMDHDKTPVPFYQKTSR